MTRQGCMSPITCPPAALVGRVSAPASCSPALARRPPVPHSMCESVASLKGVCLIPHQKALVTSERRLQRQLAIEATLAPASGVGGVCQDVFRLPPTSAVKLGARCRGERGNGRGLPCVSLIPAEPWLLFPCFLPPAGDHRSNNQPCVAPQTALTLTDVLQTLAEDLRPNVRD